VRDAISMLTDRQPLFSVLWHCPLLASSEYASLGQDEGGFYLRGVVALPKDDIPCLIEYHVVVNRHWFPRSASATVTTSQDVREMRLATDGSMRWTLNGNPAPMLDGCRDIDLGWTPATNTIPIRRLGLDVGESATITEAWITFPDLDAVKNEQTYERLADSRWRYRSGEYDFELMTDEASGLVVAYGEDLWRGVAMVETPRRRR
jgi:uncharacterized protein